jgi:hypothetical protein
MSLLTCPGGTVPYLARGDYIFHPPWSPGDQESIAGCIATVTWRTHDRVNGKFVMTARPYAEIHLRS